MSTSASIGSQTLLKIGDGASPEVFTTIAEVTSIGSFGQKNDLKEATHMLSTAKEYKYGLPDGSEIPVEVNYIPGNAQHVALLAAQAAKTTKNFKMYFNSDMGGLAMTFSALIIGWQIPTLTPNEIVKMQFSLKVSGAITGPA